jgi:hypothetical protein
VRLLRRCASPSTSGSSTLLDSPVCRLTAPRRRESLDRGAAAARPVNRAFFHVQVPTRGETKSLPAHQEEKEREEPEDHGVSGPQQHEPVHEDGAASPLATIVCQRSADLENNLVKYAHCHAVSQAASSAPAVDADRDSAPGRGQVGYPPPVGRSPCPIAPSTAHQRYNEAFAKTVAYRADIVRWSSLRIELFTALVARRGKRELGSATPSRILA